MSLEIENDRLTLGDGMPVHLARPSREGRYPVVLLLHERYGLVQHTIDLADKLATEGYVVAAPDLYFAAPDQESLKRGDKTVHLSDGEVLTQLEAVRSALGELEFCDVDKVGIIGACQTGRHSFVFASQIPVRACAFFYGATSGWDVSDKHPIAMEKMIAATSAPVFGLFGELDHTIPIKDVQRLRDTLETHDKDYEILVYAGAPHGWLNATMPGRYRHELSEAAWARLVAYLERCFSDGRDEDIIRWRFECGKSANYDFSKNRRLE